MTELHVDAARPDASSARILDHGAGARRGGRARVSQARQERAPAGIPQGQSAAQDLRADLRRRRAHARGGGRSRPAGLRQGSRASTTSSQSSAPSSRSSKKTPGRPTRVKATVEVRPAIELRDYKGVAVSRAATPVTDDDVERSLRSLAKERATLVPVQRAARLGDVATLDYAGTIDGTPFDGGSATGQDNRSSARAGSSRASSRASSG